MSRKHIVPAMVIAAVSLVLVLLQPGLPASGQSDQSVGPASNGRYQVATFSSGSTPGYYIIDTQTGAMWHNYRGDKPSKISGPLAESK